MIRANPVHALGGLGHAAENVAAADDQAELDAGLERIGNLGGYPLDSCQVDAERLRPHEDFARDFQEDTLEGKFGHVHPIEMMGGLPGDTIFSALTIPIRKLSRKGRQMAVQTKMAASRASRPCVF